MNDFSLEKLDALIAKGRELKKLLTQTPEILTYLQLIKKRRNTPSFSYGDISRNKVSA